MIAARILLASLLALAGLPALAALKPPEDIDSSGIPPIPDELASRLQPYQNVRGARLAGWLGDQGLLIYTRFAQTAQLHLLRQPGGARSQLTFDTEPVRFAAPAPSYAQGFIFGRDDRGGENYQLYHYNPLSAESVNVSNLSGRHAHPVWARSGNYLSFANNSRNSRDNDIYLLEMRTGKITPVLQRAGSWYPLDFSPDERWLLAARYKSANDVRIYLVSLETEEVRPIDSDAFPAAQLIAKFAPDGSGIWYISDRQSEHTSLRFMNLITQEETVISSDPDYGVTNFAVSHDGDRVAYTVNEGGFDRLRLHDVSRQRNERLPPSLSDAGTRIYEIAFSPDDSQLAVSLGSPSMPGDVFTLSLDRKPMLTRWSNSELGNLRDQLLSQPEIVRYPTFDSDLSGRRRLVPAFFYRPPGEGPHPVLIWVHGGPESQARPTFNSTLYYLLRDLDIAVLRPNIRGSSGYGKNYLKLDNHFKREDAVRDIGSLLDWIASRPELDYRRVGIMGGSYGGYVALAAMLRYGNRIRAGSTMSPISNFISFIESTPLYLRDLRRAEYGDERDPQMRAFLARISPRRQINQLQAPLLIVQGLNDPRIPASETRTLVEQIRRNDGLVWYLTAANEGHGFAQKANHDFYQAVLAQFWSKHLLGRKEDLPEQTPGL